MFNTRVDELLSLIVFQGYNLTYIIQRSVDRFPRYSLLTLMIQFLFLSLSTYDYILQFFS